MAYFNGKVFGIGPRALWAEIVREKANDPLPAFSCLLVRNEKDYLFTMFHIGSGVGFEMGKKAREAMQVVGEVTVGGVAQRRNGQPPPCGGCPKGSC